MLFNSKYNCAKKILLPIFLCLEGIKDKTLFLRKHTILSILEMLLKISRQLKLFDIYTCMYVLCHEEFERIRVTTSSQQSRIFDHIRCNLYQLR